MLALDLGVGLLICVLSVCFYKKLQGIMNPPIDNQEMYRLIMAHNARLAQSIVLANYSKSLKELEKMTRSVDKLLADQ